MSVHVLEIGMDVIRTPIQWIRFDFQIISGQVTRRISKAVELIPEDAGNGVEWKFCFTFFSTRLIYRL